MNRTLILAVIAILIASASLALQLVPRLQTPATTSVVTKVITTSGTTITTVSTLSTNSKYGYIVGKTVAAWDSESVMVGNKSAIVAFLDFRTLLNNTGTLIITNVVGQLTIQNLTAQYSLYPLDSAPPFGHTHLNLIPSETAGYVVVSFAYNDLKSVTPNMEFVGNRLLTITWSDGHTSTYTGNFTYPT